MDHAPTKQLDARRAETMRVLARMTDLAGDDPERGRLRDEVIRDHMAYARHIALRYSHGGGAADDLTQVAYLGLVKAVDRYDPEHGTAFLGYATALILGEIRRHFRDTTWDVHVPRRMQELTAAVRDAVDELTAKDGRAPTLAELAERLGAEVDEIVEAFDAAQAYTAASLDRPVGPEGDGAALGELIGQSDPGFEAAVDREVLKEQVARLPERDKRILLMRFFRGMSQTEIGAELGVSQMQVSRLLARILARLRAGFDEEEDEGGGSPP